MDLTTATPVEIDTVLADLYDVAAGLRSDATQAAQTVFHYAGVRPVGSKVAYYDRNPKPEATLAEALERIATSTGIQSWDRTQAERAVERLVAAKAALAANTAEQAPLHAEYNRRPWTRAYLVLASNGHVHSSMDCSTCFYSRFDDRTGEYKEGTRYGWLPRLSGHDEAEIVAEAGADACTICYPSAPVESLSRPRTVLHHTEEAAAAARAEKAAAKAAKAEAKAAKSLGEGVSIKINSYTVVETIAQAKSVLTDHHFYASDYVSADLVAQVAEALAARQGTTVEDEHLAAKKRATKRR